VKSWYALQTKSRQEATAEENLNRQGFDTYLPKISLKKRRRDKWVPVTEPLFSRYLFIQVDADEQSLAPVRSTLGVASLVRFGHLLRPLPNEVIAHLKQAESPSSHQREDAVWPHQPGDLVEVLTGPFAGLTGIYQMQKGEDRALLLLSLLGSTQQIALPIDSLG
jgi:transcriptional antiterminator RfaH